MIRIDLRPVWRFKGETEREFDFQLIAILGELDASGKLTQAAEKAGISYRHAWNLVAEWEAFFGAPLVTKERGKGSSLTALGERLLWAGRRAQARLAPELANLAEEFERSLNEPVRDAEAGLVMQASHDFAVAALREIARGAGLALDLQYKGSFDALAALRRGECDLAGFHVPEGAMGELMRRRYAEGLPPDRFRFVQLARRVQGFVVRAGNPCGIRTVSDLGRAGVRMVNRQRGSGTRALLEFFIAAEGLDRSRLQGYENEESTHGAVAALVAGQQADVGLAVQAAAAAYHLDFVPLCEEGYFLACHASLLDTPALRRLLSLLRGDDFRTRVAALAGYDVEGAGTLLSSLEPSAAAR